MYALALSKCYRACNSKTSKKHFKFSTVGANGHTVTQMETSISKNGKGDMQPSNPL